MDRHLNLLWLSAGFKHIDDRSLGTSDRESGEMTNLPFFRRSLQRVQLGASAAALSPL
jgi:hypothetical protein